MPDFAAKESKNICKQIRYHWEGTNAFQLYSNFDSLGKDHPSL